MISRIIFSQAHKKKTLHKNLHLFHRNSPYPGRRRIVAIPQRAVVPAVRGRQAAVPRRPRAPAPRARAPHQVPLPERGRPPTGPLRAVPGLSEEELQETVRVPGACYR